MENIFYKKDFDYFIDRVKNNQHFKYSRFNDGELIALSGKSPNGSNCDGHQYFPKMGEELKNILLNYNGSDDYILESFDYWYKTSGFIKKIHNNLQILNPNLRFLYTDFIRILHEQNPEKFNTLLDIIKTKKIIIVGPEYLSKLSRFFDFKHIIVPTKNCYLEKDKIIQQMEIIKESDENLFFLLSASMPANIVIDYFKEDKNNTYLDWGSVWDTFFISPEFNFIKKRSTSNKDSIKKEYKKYLI